MPAATQPAPAAPRRRVAASKPTAVPVAPSARKLSAAAVEATAAAFVAGFRALPGAVRGRVVQLIEAAEDEADAREVAAFQAARAAGSPEAETVPWEQVKAELAARKRQRPSPADTDMVPAQAA